MTPHAAGSVPQDPVIQLRPPSGMPMEEAWRHGPTLLAAVEALPEMRRGAGWSRLLPQLRACHRGVALDTGVLDEMLRHPETWTGLAHYPELLGGEEVRLAALVIDRLRRDPRPEGGVLRPPYGALRLLALQQGSWRGALWELLRQALADPAIPEWGRGAIGAALQCAPPGACPDGSWRAAVRAGCVEGAFGPSGESLLEDPRADEGTLLALLGAHPSQRLIPALLRTPRLFGYPGVRTWIEAALPLWPGESRRRGLELLVGRSDGPEINARLLRLAAEDPARAGRALRRLTDGRVSLIENQTWAQLMGSPDTTLRVVAARQLRRRPAAAARRR